MSLLATIAFSLGDAFTIRVKGGVMSASSSSVNRQCPSISRFPIANDTIPPSPANIARTCASDASGAFDSSTSCGASPGPSTSDGSISSRSTSGAGTA